jgi:hypothetical protein
MSYLERAKRLRAAYERNETNERSSDQVQRSPLTSFNSFNSSEPRLVWRAVLTHAQPCTIDTCDYCWPRGPVEAPAR